MHQANKYMRVQDQNGQIAVIVPETDFILHARQMRDLTNKVEKMNEDLKTLNAKNHDYITYKSGVNELITKEVQKARTQQRQEDAKVYAHWRDKAKSLEDQVKYGQEQEARVQEWKELYSKLLDKLRDKTLQLIEIKRILEHESE